MLYEKTGLTRVDKDKATSGFTLFSPLLQKKTLILNMRGEVVHEWNLPTQPGNYSYLMPNGNLLAAVQTNEGPPGLNAKGGMLCELDWKGNVLWQ